MGRSVPHIACLAPRSLTWVVASHGRRSPTARQGGTARAGSADSGEQTCCLRLRGGIFVGAATPIPYFSTAHATPIRFLSTPHPTPILYLSTASHTTHSLSVPRLERPVPGTALSDALSGRHTTLLDAISVLHIVRPYAMPVPGIGPPDAMRVQGIASPYTMPVPGIALPYAMRVPGIAQQRGKEGDLWGRAWLPWG
eukprot:1637034-Rhodomonas_salina.2